MACDNISLGLEVEFTQSFYNKTSSDTYKKAMANMFNETAKESEKLCKESITKFGAIDTGALRRGHTSESIETEALVRSEQEYWIYVCFGTYKMPARNYAQDAVATLLGKQYMLKSFKKHLQSQGVL